MSKVDVSQAICQAIDIIVDKKLANAGFNRAVQARISEIVDILKGHYKIEYQSNETDAYDFDHQRVYAVNDSVMVLIPNNDWDEQKVILGVIKNSNSDNLSESLGYNLIGLNIILNDLDIRGLSSYKRNGDSFTIPFSGNEAISGAEEINQKIKRYVKQSANGLVLSSYIRTDFANDRFTDTLGIYGVNYILKFSKKDENNNTVYYYKTYTLDTRDVVGNPYLQNKTALVTHTVKDFDPTDFEGILSITGFVKGFPADDNKELVYDVFISNIGICAAQVLSKDLNLNYNLWMTYPNGNQLTDNITSITLKANLKKDGKSFTEGVKYRWYRQNSNIRLGDNGYDSQAGAGWLCLNKINEQNVFIDYKDNDFIVTTETVEEDQRGIQVLSNIIKIKCIAFYLGQKYEASTNIYYTTGININLISSDKTIGNVNQLVYYNADKDITFTCIVENLNLTQLTQYSFLWEIAAAGYENLTSSGTSISRTLNQFTFSDIRGISKASIICTVSYSNGTFIGTVSQDLLNRKGINGEYTVNILNGNRTFQFYEDGTLAVGGDGTNFNPLLLEIFNPSGNIIPQTLASSNEAGILEILWKVPRSNCIITPIGMTDIQLDALIPDPAGSEDDFYHFKDVYSLTYTVAPYSSANINNIILVYIAYRLSTGDADIKILKGSTTFASIRAGDPGTNGTDTASTIVGHITQSDTEVVSKRYYAHVYTDLNQNTPSLILKYTDNNLTFDDFKFKLIQNGIDLDVNTSSNALLWQLPIQKAISFESYFTNSNNFNLTNDFINNVHIPVNIGSIQNIHNVSNILRAIYNINDLVYYANMPICYVYAPSNYRFILNPTSGYTYVMYTNQGNFPKYDNNNLFVIQVYLHDPGEDWKLKTDNLTYTWSIYSNDGTILNNANGLQLISQNGNTAIIEPQANFQTNNLTPAIICLVTLNNNTIGVLYYPIYMMYNQYGLKYLNDWDGNSIDLLADGNSTILAPQIGAGKKENDHSFSGILLGEVQTPGSQLPSQIGLFGYDNGLNSFFLDAKDGSATIGKSGAGQILVNKDSNGLAIIQSGDYPIGQNNQPAGMKIKFSSTGGGEGEDEQGPYIKFGTGNFEVDHEGKIKATEGTIAGWGIDDDKIYKTETENNPSKVFMNSNLDLLLNKVPSSYSSYAGLPMFLRAGGINNDEINFFVTHNGHLYAKDTYIEGNGRFTGNITANSGKIGDWDITSPNSTTEEKGTIHNSNIIMGNFTRNSWSYNDVVTRFGGCSYKTDPVSWYITAGEGRSNLSSINFAIDKKGYLYANGAYIKGTIQATSGYIGTKASGWQIDGNEIRTSDSLIYINADKNNRSTTLFENEHPFLRVGETKNRDVHFMVTHLGSLFANRAKITGTITAEGGTIGGWNIGTNALSAYNGAVVLKAGTKGTTNMIEVTNSGSTVFAVNGNGALTATQGTIGGWKINSASLSTYDDKVILRKGTATTSKVIEVLNNGKTVFSVTGAGKLTATNAAITGDITAKSLTIDKDATITGTISASHIKGGKLDASSVTITNLDVTGKIEANSLSVGKLKLGSDGTSVAWRSIQYINTISFNGNTRRFMYSSKSISVLAQTGVQSGVTDQQIGPVFN